MRGLVRGERSLRRVYAVSFAEVEKFIAANPLVSDFLGKYERKVWVLGVIMAGIC